MSNLKTLACHSFKGATRMLSDWYALNILVINSNWKRVLSDYNSLYQQTFLLHLILLLSIYFNSIYSIHFFFVVVSLFYYFIFALADIKMNRSIQLRSNILKFSLVLFNVSQSKWVVQYAETGKNSIEIFDIFYYLYYWKSY